MKLEQRDCVVIGGGPAGSTFAGIVKKYAPEVSLTVLEQARFPRYHIGESTIPSANGVLQELGVLDALHRSQFVKKLGIVFVWGEDRKPWNADFLRLRDLPDTGSGSDIVDVTGKEFNGVLYDLKDNGERLVAFNVLRAEFDDLLLKQARTFGAEVREETRVTEVLRDAAGKVEGVRWEDRSGQSGTLLTPFVLDASGLSSLMTRGNREYHPDMNNFAVYGYLSNADWKVTFSGTRERSTVFISTVDQGWIWYFPLTPDIMSVGVVTNRKHFSERMREQGLEEFWWEALRSSPEVSELIRGATLRTDVLPDGKRVAASQDWSSWARSFVGPGWASAGDAAMFVDPILSSGLTMALQSGHRAAYTYLTARARPELPAASLWNAYADYLRGEAGAYLTLAKYFYGNNRMASSWWWQSQQVVNRSGRLELDDHQSFTMATAGFFPTPRAISPEVVGSLLEHLSGTRSDLQNVFRDSGVPQPEQLARCSLEVLTPFRLELRTEPDPRRAGQLDIYHDLLSEDPGFAHRAAAVPCRIGSAMAPVVEALPRHRQVATLLEEAPRLLAPGLATPESIRASTLAILRIAAMKGYVRLSA